MKSFRWATIFMVLCITHKFIEAKDENILKLKEKFKWKNIEYKWPSLFAKEEAIRASEFKTKNILPTGFDLWKDKLFITTPRLFCYFWCFYVNILNLRI